MRKHTLLILTLLLGSLAMTARPVDTETAKAIGREFLYAKTKNALRNNDLHLVYTGVSTRGEACFYVFNSGTDSFVIVSADDRFRPIVGYSDEGSFDTENMSPELAFYLEKIIEARTSRNAVVFDDVAEEWQSVKTSGKLLSRNGGRGVDHICQTLWNQDSPYNLYAPEAGSGPGGRCYAGCVATAMSQVMKRWDYPTKGTGSHYYYCQGYGRLEANFGQTNYDWAHMPNRLNGANEEEIEAVALLMYHCAVAVDMNFSPNGSGANTWDVPESIRRYFSYTSHATIENRDSYSLTNWQNLLKQQFNIGWPVYYSGFNESGGHAFVCDGYDDNDLFHYNWGWGGSGDGWFVIDEIDFADWAQAVCNFVPTNVYDYMPMQPDNFSVESSGDIDYAATLHWTNPTQNVLLHPLTSLDRIVVTRNGEVIYTQNNVTPGAQMSFTDHYMPAVVNYSVYAISHDAKGLESIENDVFLGPSCIWTVEMTSSEANGWHDGSLSFVSTEGKEVAHATLSTSQATQSIRLPLGHIDILWNKPAESIDNISFSIKNSLGHEEIAFEGASTDLNPGLFFIANNACENTAANLNGPNNLTVAQSNNVVTLSWEAIHDREVLHYQVYRDNLLYAITNATSFTYTENNETLHNYYVVAFTEDGETHPSNRCNVQPESEYMMPTNLRYEMTTPTKAKISWDAPQQAEGLRGYMVYRRQKGGDFKRIKLLAATSFSDNLGALADTHFEYVVCACYTTSNFTSAYASSQDHPELNFIEVNKTIIPQNLTFTIEEGHVVLHWQQATMASSYNIYRDGEPIARGVTGTVFIDHDSLTSQVYQYYVTGCTDFIESNPSNQAIVDWTTDIHEGTKTIGLQVYPNPTNGILTIEASVETASQPATCRIFNLMGQEVMRQSLDADKTNIDVSGLPDGAYFVKVATPNGTETYKIVKIQ